jgi:hypothetical protein
MRVYGHPCRDLTKHITDLDSHGTDPDAARVAGTVNSVNPTCRYTLPISSAHRRPLQLRTTADLFGVDFSSLTARQ